MLSRRKLFVSGAQTSRASLPDAAELWAAAAGFTRRQDAIVPAIVTVRSERWTIVRVPARPPGTVVLVLHGDWTQSSAPLVNAAGALAAVFDACAADDPDLCAAVQAPDVLERGPDRVCGREEKLLIADQEDTNRENDERPEDEGKGTEFLAAQHRVPVPAGQEVEAICFEGSEPARSQDHQQEDEVDDLGQHTFLAPMEGYIQRMLWCLVHQGVIPADAAYDPWGPPLDSAEFDRLGACLARVASCGTAAPGCHAG